MAINIKKVRVEIPATNIAVDFDVTSFGTPQAAIIVAGNTVSDDTDEDEFLFSYGFWDGTNIVNVSGWIEHNVDSAVPAKSRRSTSSSLAMHFQNDGGNIRTATVTATNTDGIELTFAGTTSQQGFVEVWLINGCNDAVAGSSTNSDTIGTPGVTVSGLGMTPKALFTAQAGNIDAAVGRHEIALGFAADNGSSIDQFGMLQVAHNGLSATGMIRTDCVSMNGANSFVYTRQEIKSMSSGQFVRWTENVQSGGTPSDNDLCYLALDFDEEVRVFNSTVPTTDVDWVPWSGGSFAPGAVIMIPTHHVALNTEENGGNATFLGMYIFDGDNEGQMSGTFQDKSSGLSDSSNRMSSSEIFVQYEAGGTPEFAAGADANTFSVSGEIRYDKDDPNWNNGVAAYYVGGIVFGAAGAGGGGAPLFVHHLKQMAG